jgi:hypothetical protein
LKLQIIAFVKITVARHDFANLAGNPNMHLKGEWERDIVRKIDHTRIYGQLKYISTNQFLKKNIFHHMFPTTTRKDKIKTATLLHTWNESKITIP